MATIIGLQNTLAIIAIKGGDTLYVPSQYKPDHWLQEVLTDDAYRKLCFHYANEKLEMPRCVEALSQLKSFEILEDAQYLTQPELARKYHCSRRWINERLKRARQNIEHS
ncbi:MAG: Mor transcription activator family protein [Methylococcales bacterium]